MRTGFMLVCCLSLALASGAGGADKPNCAVLPFKAMGTTPSGMAEIITERVFFEVARAGRYRMIERAQVERLLKEKQISTIMSDSAGIEAGRDLGAQFIVIGSVGQLGQLTTINSRIVDVETGAIVAQAANDHEGRVEDLMRVAEASARQLLGITVAETTITTPAPPAPPPPPVIPVVPLVPISEPAPAAPAQEPVVPAPLPGGPLVEGQPGVLDLGDGVLLDLVWIAPGQFDMGAGGRSRGRPTTIPRGFWMGRCEVSNRQYQRFVKAADYAGPRDGNPNHLHHFTQQRVYTGPDYPIIWVSWINANSFCTWVTAHAQAAGQLGPSGRVRLPSEAEWEFACRAGTRTTYYNGDRPAELGRICWSSETCGRHGPKAVGLKTPNAWGLCDMLGNAAEWVQEKALRGGAWNLEADECSCRYRRAFDPAKADIYTGFRIAVSPN